MQFIAIFCFFRFGLCIFSGSQLIVLFLKMRQQTMWPRQLMHPLSKYTILAFLQLNPVPIFLPPFGPISRSGGLLLVANTLWALTNLLLALGPDRGPRHALFILFACFVLVPLP